jgi:uncharacterized damage-inducible protein DinB
MHDLFAYNDWANGKLLQLCAGLDDAQLDARQPMGFGSLRATLHHIALAERLWLDRWQSKAWAPLDRDAAGVSLTWLNDCLGQIAGERNALLDAEAANRFSREVAYRNTANEPFRHRIRELLVHLVNHGIYHRAQALNFLRPHGRRVSGGLDYLFYKLVRPTLRLGEGTAAALQEMGLEIGVEVEPAPPFDIEIIRRYCAYGDWAMDRLIEAAGALDPAQLDQVFEIGPGSLRAVLHHIGEAEMWWYGYWTGQSKRFEMLARDLPFADFVAVWRQSARGRNQWLASGTSERLAEPVTARAGNVGLTVRVGESVLQLCGHGTHHRAQAVNMLRRLGCQPPATDYIVWLRGPGELQATD